MTVDVMIDLETIGQTVNSGILTIGAIKFDRHQDFSRMEFKDMDDLLAKTGSKSFYCRVDVKSLEEEEFDWGQDTMDWWGRQSTKARHEAFDALPRIHIGDALQRLHKWIDKDDIPWSHGSDYDLILLKTAWERYEKNVPWLFWNARCTRTLYDVCGLTKDDIKARRSTNHHHALADCWDQLLMVQECYRKLKDAV
jgi:hypothetical protein